VALYLWLVLHKPMLYFDVLTTSFKYLFLSLSISYAIIALSMRVYEYHNRAADSAYSVVRRLRFYDNQHNLKLVIMPQSLLYIEAEENYVRINYVENERSKEFVLRSSMKSLDETCQEYGMVRCHRSFYINPAHIKVLRKDKDGIMYAELDADDVRTIPVSKTYYKMLSDML
jgi:DNA-binding LytR/AlgR family response regulator